MSNNAVFELALAVLVMGFVVGLCIWVKELGQKLTATEEKLKDAEIEKDVHSLSNIELNARLEKALGGGTPSEPVSVPKPGSEGKS